MNRQDLRTAPQSNIFKASIEQFGRELGNMFPDRLIADREDVPVFLIKSSGDLKDIRDQKQDNKFAIPLFTYKLSNMTIVKDRFNRNTLRNRGILTKKVKKPEGDSRLDDPNVVYKSLHLTPVDVTMEVVFICSYEDQLYFGPIWQQAAENKFLSFPIDIDDITISIKVQLSEDIDFTDINFDDAMSYVQCTTSAVMSTYHGVESNTKPFNSIRVDTGIIPHGENSEKEILPSMTIKKNKDTTFTIKRRIEGEN